MDSQIRDDQLQYSLTTLQEKYRAFAACEKKPWMSADDRAQARTDLETSITKAREVLQHLDRQRVIAPTLQRLKSDLIIWTTQADGTVRELETARR